MNDPKDHLSIPTPTSFSGETGIFRTISTCLCARWDLVDLHGLSNVLPKGDLFGYNFHR